MKHLRAELWELEKKAKHNATERRDKQDEEKK